MGCLRPPLSLWGQAPRRQAGPHPEGLRPTLCCFWSSFWILLSDLLGPEAFPRRMVSLREGLGEGRCGPQRLRGRNTPAGWGADEAGEAAVREHQGPSLARQQHLQPDCLHCWWTESGAGGQLLRHLPSLTPGRAPGGQELDRGASPWPHSLCKPLGLSRCLLWVSSYSILSPLEIAPCHILLTYSLPWLSLPMV